MIDKVIYVLGIIVLISFLSALSGFFIYIAYDYWLKRLLGWKQRKIRENIFYFIRNSEKIKEHIENIGDINEEERFEQVKF